MDTSSEVSGFKISKSSGLFFTPLVAFLLFAISYTYLYKQVEVIQLGYMAFDLVEPVFLGYTAAFWFCLMLSLVYLYECAGYIAPNERGLQAHMSRYTGEEFGPGVYLLPKYPIPFVMFLCELFGIENKFGWYIETTTKGANRSVSVLREIVMYTAEQIEVSVTVRFYFILDLTVSDLAGQNLVEQAGDSIRENFIQEFQYRIEYRSLVSSRLLHELTDVAHLGHGITLDKVSVEKVVFTNERIKSMFQELAARELTAQALAHNAREMQMLKSVFPEGTNDLAIAAIYSAFLISRK